MVVISAARIAQREPRTHLAVLRWLGIGVRFKLPRFFELTSHVAEIGDVASNLESLGSSRAPEHNMHPPGLRTLNPRQQVRIKAKLNRRCRLGGACELGFHDFVRPRPEGAGSVDPNKKVRPTTPRRI